MSFGAAYAVKKRGKKCMARGGDMEPEHMAEGGMIESEHGEQSDEQMLDMVGHIMKKHYSKGGQVANDVGIAEADEEPAEYDDLVLRDDDMEDADYTGENSGDEIGNEGEDERRRDIIARIMHSRSKRDRMPRPA